jgi:short-subunit dehydrogenase
MVKSKTKGRIVMIGDPLASHYVIPSMSPYSCSKVALEQLAYHMKSEFEPLGIKVHYFLPPPMETKLLID